jgi:hypothetical protein
MKKVYKLALDDFDADDYSLIAIHSGLEDYRLAYFINRQLNIRLERCPKDIAYTVQQGKALFSRYVYEDETNNDQWNLIQNKDTALSTQTDTTLFGNSGVSVSIYLLPEVKNADYLLKTENIRTDKTVQLLSGLQYISAAYTVDPRRLRSKNNLIF